MSYTFVGNSLKFTGCGLVWMPACTGYQKRETSRIIMLLAGSPWMLELSTSNKRLKLSPSYCTLGHVPLKFKGTLCFTCGLHVCVHYSEPCGFSICLMFLWWHMWLSVWYACDSLNKFMINMMIMQHLIANEDLHGRNVSTINSFCHCFIYLHATLYVLLGIWIPTLDLTLPCRRAHLKHSTRSHK